MMLNEEQRSKLIDALARDDNHQFKVDRDGATWKAVKQEIERLKETDYQSTLRNRKTDHGQTQYARGALDALDSLLEFGGEEV
jgi:hypothetical protein